MALWGLTGPSTQALMSRRVSPSEQGRLQGALSSLQGIAGLIGPGVFTLTFAYCIAPQRGWELPGAPFLLAALLLLGGMAMGAWATREG
jgi:DHA1 family tetracycline resistance protein-like MFS transporter